MWERVCHFFRRRLEPEDPLVEFEEGLLLIVDAEQFANNLRSKLRRAIEAQDTIVYLAGVGPCGAASGRRDRRRRLRAELSGLPAGRRREARTRGLAPNTDGASRADPG